MNGLKQRVIGAVVLVSLAVIFIPMVFEEPHKQNKAQILPIPEKPEVPAFTIELPDAPERPVKPGGGDPFSDTPDNGKKQSAQVDSLTRPTEAENLVTEGRQMAANDSPAMTAREKNAADSQHAGTVAGSETEKSKNLSASKTTPSVAPDSWTVQIGTFKNSSGAMKIKDELNKAGTPAYTQEISSGGIVMVRVFAGPVATRKKANRLKKTLDKRYKVQSLVRRYKVPQEQGS